VCSQDFQFFPKRFMQLAEKERYWTLRQDGHKVTKLDKEKGEKMDDTQLEEARLLEQEKIDNGTLV